MRKFDYKFTKREKLFIIIGLAVIINFGIWDFYFQPKLRTLAEMENQIREYAIEIEESMVYIMDERREGIEWSEEEERLNVFFPPLAEKSEVIKALENLIFSSDIYISSLNFNAVESRETADVIEIFLSGGGSYEEVKLFLNNLEKFPYLLITENHSFSFSEKEVSFKLTAYLYFSK